MDDKKRIKGNIHLKHISILYFLYRLKGDEKNTVRSIQLLIASCKPILLSQLAIFMCGTQIYSMTGWASLFRPFVVVCVGEEWEDREGQARVFHSGKATGHNKNENKIKQVLAGTRQFVLLFILTWFCSPSFLCVTPIKWNAKRIDDGILYDDFLIPLLRRAPRDTNFESVLAPFSPSSWR